MKIKPIETERLLLRGFTKDDAPFALSIWNDPDMSEYLPDPLTMRRKPPCSSCTRRWATTTNAAT